jgi:uncharacterized membrane protein YoaK (UPF0700 family)
VQSLPSSDTIIVKFGYILGSEKRKRGRLLTLASKKRSASKNLWLGAMLALVAGAINAGGFFLVQQYTSHMTGIISLAADSIALGEYFYATLMLIYIASFIGGSAFTTILVIKAKRKHLHSQYALTLMCEAMLLVAIALFWHFRGEDHTDIIPQFIMAFCFLMGLQNALITKASSAIIRTTHITGMTTDLGIEMGRLLMQENRAEAQRNSGNAKRHLMIIFSFFAGGIVGAMGVKWVGALAFMLLGLLLAILSFPLIYRDIKLMCKLRQRRVKGVLK